MNELLIAKRWLIDRLKQNSALVATLTNGGKRTRIYDTNALQDAPFPYVLIQLQDNGTDVNALGAERVITNITFNVRAVGQVSTYFDQLSTLAEQIDEQLHCDEPTAFNPEVYHDGLLVGFVIASTRLSPFESPSIDHGIDYRELGGIYQLIAQQAGG